MQVDIIPIGNSRGIRIPKALLKECGFEKSAELTVENKRLILKKPTAAKNPRKKKPREGWDAAFKKMAAQQVAEGEETLLLGDFPNEFDHTEWTTHPEWE